MSGKVISLYRRPDFFKCSLEYILVSFRIKGIHCEYVYHKKKKKARFNVGISGAVSKRHYIEMLGE